ncbi:uncharacterized protein LOC106662576 [Cimex lectularius]|uniref:MADF domain-containing protein n=1 Tax=Cimex lectularius TaxID=79782 RepID=A0A8I6TBZ3_CIMLE|nr:uncharacterized protein LOC106662576 [Cimex lectularius]
MSKRKIPRIILQRSLIMEVRKRRELWDFNHERYNNKMVLLKAWDDISKIFNTSSRKIEIQWRKLRDLYRKELLQHRKTGKASTWQHYEKLSFLKNAYDYSLKANTVGSSDEKSEDQDSDRDSLNELKIIKTESLNSQELVFESPETGLQEEVESKVFRNLSDDGLKDFLLSLLPEIEPMDNKQMREFKKQVSSLVQSILD